jgi:hypothetical protein
MLFINPMWDNESERIGEQKCTPLGYAVHTLSDLLGFIALLLLLGVGAYLGYRSIAGTFDSRLLCVVTVPFALGLLASALYRYSWMLAHQKDFR